jgi:hypothetical protein
MRPSQQIVGSVYSTHFLESKLITVRESGRVCAVAFQLPQTSRGPGALALRLIRVRRSRELARRVRRVGPASAGAAKA